MKRLPVFCMGMIFLMTISSCSVWQGASRREKGTTVGAGTGAAVGAGVGQAIGGDTEATLIGAAIGTVIGGIAGHEIAAYMDRQERDLQAVAAQSNALSISRSQDVLEATFKSDILFDFDSALIKPGGYAELNRVADVLNQYPQTIIRIEGHTDKSGSEEYNQRLSERRANAVKNALIQRNVMPERIQALGFGESMPISSDPASNRRVNIVIVPVKKG